MNMCNITFEVARLSTFVFGILLAQRRRWWPNIISQLGQCIVLLGSGRSGHKASALWQSSNTGQSPNSVSMLVMCLTRLTGTDPQWAATLAQHLAGIGWVDLHCVYQVHRIDAYIDLSAMVVEGIGLHVEDKLVSLVLSLIISWTFMILAHEENQ